MDDNLHNDELQQQACKKMEFYVENCIIYVDTCSLLHFAALDFFENIEDMLKEHLKKLNILSGSIKELEKHSKNVTDSNLAANAKKTLRMIEHFEKCQIVEIVEEDGFVDNTFLTLFTNIRMQQNPLLITQDINLMKDVLNINNTRSVKANKVRVTKINQYGYLSEFSNLDDTFEGNYHRGDIQQNYEKEIVVYSGDNVVNKNLHCEIKECLMEATRDEFISFCRHFLVEKISQIIPEESEIDYGIVHKIIGCIDPILFDNLNVKSNRILLVIQINSIFKEISNECISEEVLHLLIESLVIKRFGRELDKSIVTVNESQKKEIFNYVSGVDFKNFNESTYEYYCRLYLIEEIYEIIPVDSEIDYGIVAKIICSLDPILFTRLNTDMGKVTMANEISRLFMFIGDTRLPEDLLIKFVTYLGDNKQYIHSFR